MAKTRFAAAAVACLLMAPACGKKGGILAPLTLVPQVVESLTAVQRGGLIILTWANPGAYIDGRALKGISEIEIWLEEKMDPPPAPAKAKPSVPAKTGSSATTGLVAPTSAPAPATPSAPPGPFETRAKRVAVLTGALKTSAKPAANKTAARGQKPAASAPAAKAAPPNALYVYAVNPKAWTGRAFVFALRVRDAAKGRLSDFSPEVSIRPKALAAPPGRVRATVFADRVEIRWDLPPANFDGSVPPLVKGFNVYRADAEGAPRRINPVPVAGAVFADRNAVFGQTARYFVRTAGAAAEPFLESEDSETVEVTPKDIFPPAVPSGLSTAKGPDFISLVWDPVADPDAAGYHVWRREKGKAEFSRLTASPVPESTYTDKSVEKNVTYEYAITSVDTSGNESPKSAIVEETIKTLTP